MSYTFKVTARDGVLTVEPSPGVPDGTWTVSGHEDGERTEVVVDRQGVDGKPYIVASSRHMRRR